MLFVFEKMAYYIGHFLVEIFGGTLKADEIFALAGMTDLRFLIS
ncbi:hypothetical protein S2091_2579 [Solimicrobium silvestre]|uniref:Uncharacterized protein n=1 Tax=Solimicrobium silvestre TaxID=2099400 RepID=A0A2S9GYQ7_9BURK|nr:hypothetical protein S2091_2579 [Solimicrobium silvestre]